MNARERRRCATLIALAALVVVPWWTGTIWLAHAAWTWLAGFFGGPGYAGLAVGTVATLGYVVWDEHHWAAHRRRSYPYTLGGWHPDGHARLRSVPPRRNDCA